ncbi:MAG: tryptophanyl-tRNA synthetase, partial [Candidatus Berkelbacteria bacterium Athens1014_28]
ANRDPKLKENILKTAAWFLALGVDISKSVIFVQSTRPEHSELAWILNCFTTMGELSRMTQYKEKSEVTREKSTAGLFNYPVLMAADILLYQTTDVPVGEDQKQHVELARDLAIRFNNIYGKVFTVPEPIIKTSSARIMSLDNPKKKMSKSAESELSYIGLDDSSEVIRKKIQKAVTDSGDEIVSREDKPAMTNLLNIFSGVSGRDIKSLEADFTGKSYADFKKELADAIIEFLIPKQEKFKEIISDKPALKKILVDGSEKVEKLAKQTLSEVKEKIGLGI